MNLGRAPDGKAGASDFTQGDKEEGVLGAVHESPGESPTKARSNRGRRPEDVNRPD